MLNALHKKTQELQTLEFLKQQNSRHLHVIYINFIYKF